jgi:NADPH:quinone reductase-like Zn-dependent oxidoreductase
VPGPGEVLVWVKAFSLNYLDLLVIKGLYNPSLSLPHIPGSDASGVVEATGEGVRDFRPGDEVITHFFTLWQDGPFQKTYFSRRLGSEMSGVFSEYICLPAYALLNKPAYLSSAQGATLCVAGLAAWVSLVEELQVKPGNKGLILGAGGVAVFALQFARLYGAQVYMTTSSEEKADKLQQLGAKHVINYRTYPHWHLQLKEIEQQGVDWVIETAGELEKSMQVVRSGGKIKIVGFTGNSTPTINLFTALSSQLTLIAGTPGSKASFQRMLHAMESAGLHPVIDKSFTLAQVKEALFYLESGAHVGKVVVEV